MKNCLLIFLVNEQFAFVVVVLVRLQHFIDNNLLVFFESKIASQQPKKTN